MTQTRPLPTLDCRGMRCPAPILQLSKAVQRAGESSVVFEVLADDGDFPKDVRAWCRATKASLHQLIQDGTVYRALVGINGAERPASVAAAEPAPVSFFEVDLRGLRAPEPIRRLTTFLYTNEQRRVRVRSDDPAFLIDMTSWASALRATILRTSQDGGMTAVELELPVTQGPALAASPVAAITAAAKANTSASPESSLASMMAAVSASNGSPAADPVAGMVPRENLATILVIRNDLESLLASLLAATSAAGHGMQVEILFALWGVNLLRGERPRAGMPREAVPLLKRLLRWLMPKGPRRQKLGTLHLGGVGTGLMHHLMKQDNVMGLPALIEECVAQDVKFNVCTMSMGLMGIRKSDIMDLPNINWSGMAGFMESSRRAATSLVF